jgi:DNA-3-methyladenine glycosylase II
VYSGVMNSATLKNGMKYIADNDPILAELIRQWGTCTITPSTDYYHELVSSIISQQLSVKAAATIQARFLGLFNDKLPLPADILGTDTEILRKVGLSYAKVKYVRDLAERISDGRLDLETLPDMSNEAIIAELIAVKGIGEWTAHMFLIFCLGRLDVLPVGDLGIKMGIKKLYLLDHVPSPAEVAEVAAARSWHPYESIASWYIWRSLENKV